MLNSVRPAFLGATLLLLPACVTVDVETPDPQVELIEAYTGAFNARDVDAMAAMMHPEIEWWSVDEMGAELVSIGKESLAEELAHYFEAPNAVTSVFTGPDVTGPYVGGTETVSWTNDEGVEISQSALVVYQFDADGLVRRVWYYPAFGVE